MKQNRFPRLVGYELRKAFGSPWMLAFLVLLLLTNLWKLKDEYDKKTAFRQTYAPVYEDFYGRWKGEILPENVQELMAIYGPLQTKMENMIISGAYDPDAYTYSEETDFTFFESLFQLEMKYDYLYQNRAAEIVNQANALADFYARVGNDYEAKKNLDMAASFAGRQIGDFADTQWVEVWLNHDYSAMLVLLLAIFGLSSVFVMERETEMYMLLRTTRRGGGTTMAAKSLACLLYLLGICLLFFGSDALMLGLLSGHGEALGNPVYAIRLLENTPLTMTIGTYLLWATAVKSLGVVACGMIVLLLSCLCKKVLFAFLGSLGVLFLLVLLQEIAAARTALRWFNPLELVMVRDLTREISYVNLLGQPVQVYGFVLGGVILVMVLLAGAILRFNPGNMERGRSHVSV